MEQRAGSINRGGFFHQLTFTRYWIVPGAWVVADSEHKTRASQAGIRSQ